MLKRRWSTFALLVVLCSLITRPGLALADDGTGGTICTDPNDPVCDVWAGTPGGAGDSGGGNQEAGSGGSGGQNGDDSGSRCTYERAYPSPETIAALGGQPSGEGGWYYKTCYQDNGIAIGYPLMWIAGPPPGTTPEALALEARSRLRLPTAMIRLNPAGEQLVNLPTWLALDASSWQSQSATASVPGVSVTATARAVKAEWQLGDGNSVTCTGPGAVWRPGTDPAKPSPDCGYAYRRSSASAPGAAFTVRVTVTWRVTWAGAGGSGTVPGLTTTGTVSVRVAESQAVIAG